MPRNLDELRAKIEQVWEDIDPDEIRRSFDHMRLLIIHEYTVFICFLSTFRFSHCSSCQVDVKD
jgi:hypothetical protein